MSWTDPTTPQQLLCLTCVIERKQAEQAKHLEAELPPMRPAVTIAATQLGPITLLCYEHLQVHSTSPLALPGQMPIGVPR